MEIIHRGSGERLHCVDPLFDLATKKLSLYIPVANIATKEAVCKNDKKILKKKKKKNGVRVG